MVVMPAWVIKFSQFASLNNDEKIDLFLDCLDKRLSNFHFLHAVKTMRG